jgi:hypothetical protein
LFSPFEDGDLCECEIKVYVGVAAKKYKRNISKTAVARWAAAASALILRADFMRMTAVSRACLVPRRLIETEPAMAKLAITTDNEFHRSQ